MTTLTVPQRFRLHAGPRLVRRTPADWEDRPYTRFSLRPSSPTIGAELSGIDFAEDPDEQTFAELHRALLEWKVVFIRDAALDPERHSRLGRRWGQLEWHPFLPSAQYDESDELPRVVRFEKDASTFGYENIWHSDVSWREQPSLGSLLHAIEIPDVGGDTLWADMGAAYDGLDDEVKELIEGMTAVHDWWTSFGASMSPEQREALRPDFPAVEHPIVRTHPETGRKTLYVNSIFTTQIVGLDPDDGQRLLDHLCRQAAVPEYQCRFRWSAGALAIWDNRATQHYAASDYAPNRRVMERITVIGDRPF